MIQRILGRFKEDRRFKDAIEHIEIIPAKKAEYAKVDGLPENITRYFLENGIKLYRHQARALEEIRQGMNIIITTPTASGKTLAFNLPIMEKLTQDEDATALYIYPAKALSNDQLKVLKELESELGLTLNPNVYDGDTPRDKRPWIRANSRIIITNPYQLHRILPWHRQWRRFYKNLKFIVVDEAHQYRGVFGSNVAFLIRRLKRICKYYGSNPQFILSSATLANPEEFAEKLVGEKFKLISEDASPSGRKYFILYNPARKKDKPSTHQETKNILAYFVFNKLQSLCFTVSRRMAELIARWTREELDKKKKELVYRVTAYRAGYRPEDRRKIEEGLRNGELLGVSTTNALELGIDIGTLDTVIISGYPGTMISTWQQAGRAGRKENDSIIILVAFENPLDQYLMKNPSFIFEKSHENAIIDLKNKFIVWNQTACAASELPLNLEDFFEHDFNLKIVQRMLREGELTITDKGLVYNGRDPQFSYGLDQISDDTFTVIENGRVLEKMDRGQAYREAHEGAVLINRGETYTVDEFNLNERRIHVTKKSVDYHTQALKRIDLKIIKVLRKRKFSDLNLYLGEVEVTEDYYLYRVMAYSKVLGAFPLNLPPLKFRSKAIWFTIPNKLGDHIRDKFDEEAFGGGLHGCEHAIISLFPLHVLCDRMDIGGLSTAHHPDTGKATIFVYDAFEGGIGLAEKAFALFEDLIASTFELVDSCGCFDGCPSCIYSPRCGNDNKPLHKGATRSILAYLKKVTSKPAVDIPGRDDLNLEVESVYFEVYSLYRDGKFAEAKLKLHDILEENPGDARAWYLMGAILSRQGEEQMAAYFHGKTRKE
ncbi:MAG TPA: DEAD/DEAH box helicase [Methanothermobacter sp.]|uniref:DEAD/DEAH box helicase n=1 Tax=Methanothermobacter tenebrarum TaxID=680118 RepID=A0ABN6PBD4_9EURY|nr:DEAD/DEAH box helicase [Methanothermobacter tenebrarum]BDH79552.1 DEAD/DEAH box helicase [Methanothermobacter tenebrarum]HHW15816.1 DEAD/DEAH box helicase [Methanothermobacter sp.]